MAHSFFTIGHSTRPISMFVELLKGRDIALVVDVRTMPRPRTNPQYNRDSLAASLQDFGIGYEHLDAPGGLRARSPGIPPSLNANWRNRSFHNYADYALSDKFQSGLSRLRGLGHDTPCAIMCAENLWWRCHCRIIIDYPLAAGEAVIRILDPGQVQAARITEGATIAPEDTLTYPAAPLLL